MPRRMTGAIPDASSDSSAWRQMARVALARSCSWTRAVRRYVQSRSGSVSPVPARL